MSSRTLLPNKYVGETLTVQFDFVSVLVAGVTISSQVVAATVYSGVDASPSGIISGSAGHAGTVVSQKITDGGAGNIYDLACTITTSDSQTLIMNGFIAVLPSQP